MTYFDKISHHDEQVLEMLIREAPHTRFIEIKPGFDFLKGVLVDLGFENYESKLGSVIYKEFTKNGVGIPNTPYKMRAEWGTAAIIEPRVTDEKIVELPQY